MKTEPQKEHQWLQKLVGEWTYETEMTMGPGEPVMKSTGSESVRTLGNLWVLAEGHWELGGGSETTMMTLGYDPQRKRYLGTWVASMMTHMWVYDGAVDAAGSTLTLDTEGPHMSREGEMAKYQDIIEFKSDDHRVLASQVLDDDGKWQRFLTSNYRRK